MEVKWDETAVDAIKARAANAGAGRVHDRAVGVVDGRFSLRMAQTENGSAFVIADDPRAIEDEFGTSTSLGRPWVQRSLTDGSP